VALPETPAGDIKSLADTVPLKTALLPIKEVAVKLDIDPVLLTLALRARASNISFRIVIDS